MPYVDCHSCGYAFYSSSHDSIHSRYCSYCTSPSSSSNKYAMAKYEPAAMTTYKYEPASKYDSLTRYEPRTVTKYIVQKKHEESSNKVTGFTRRDAQYIVNRVFSQPRGSDVSAREVTFERGRFSVREEYGERS